MHASKLTDVYDCFASNPINIKDFDKYYVDVDKGRGLTPLKKMKRLFEKNPGGSYKFLFAGYKGCGKSTELNRLQKDLHDDFIVLNFSVRHELDILNISYIELFIALMKRLFQFANEEKKIKIPKEYIKNITNWVKSKEIVDIDEKYLGMNVEAGATAEGGIPFLAKFFANFTASAKASSSLKETLRETVEPKLSELILNCNLLINEIKNQLEKISKKGLIIIVEDMDKIDLQKGEDIFYIHSAQLTQLNCHTIFTFPIALKYYIRFTAIKNNYTDSFDLPMIKVRNKDGSLYEEGRSLMKEIIKHRMADKLFAGVDIIDKMIDYSGGCLFDLFRMIRDAADNALDFDREKIEEEDFDVAYLYLKSDYENTISENEAEQISVDRYYEVLAECAKDEKKKPRQSKELLDLRNNLTVLGYNGENWSDVHPVVRDILEERGLIDGKK
jgi:hypothetical protein